jgi:hypothetical protein
MFVIADSPYYVFVALCIVVIVVSLIKIAASNENIECFREYFAVGYRAPDPSFFLKFLHGSGQKISHLAGLSELFRVGVCFDKVGGCWKTAV